MTRTPVSLIERLCQPNPDPADWRAWFALYTPLLHRWLLRLGLQPADADDVGQNVLRYVVETLPDFRRRGDGSFRGWLRANLRHRVQEFWAARERTAAAPLDELADPNSELSRLFDREHDEHVRRELLAVVKSEVGDRAWQAFELQVLQGLSADATAARLGLSWATVVSHKSRVLKRLRDEAAGLLE